MSLIALMINLLILALVFAVFWWVFSIAAGAIGIPGNIVQILRAIVAVIMLFWLLAAIAGMTPLIWRPMVVSP